MSRRVIACLVLVLVCLGAASAAAQDSPPAGHRPEAAHRHRSHPKPADHAAGASSGSVQKVWSDLVHGSAEQQELERQDNDQAHATPINHSKDSFFSDWRGLK